MLSRMIISLMLSSYAAAVFANTQTPAPSSAKQMSSHDLPVKDWLAKVQSKRPALSFHVGGFWATQGKTQDISITGLLGDSFSVSHHVGSNGLLGIGAYLDGWAHEKHRVQYGIDAFYMAKTSVQGFVTQEQYATNLAYGYNITNWPIFFGIRTLSHYFEGDRYDVTFNLGIGPNIIQANNFQETALVSYALPDEIYASRTNVAFAAMTGVGLKFNNAFGKAPLECGYRFFYLGEGSLKTINSQVLTSLKTGQNYANTLMCSLEIE